MQKEEKIVVVLLLMALGSLAIARMAFGDSIRVQPRKNQILPSLWKAVFWT